MGPGVRIPQSRPLFYKDAPVAELADALDLGSSVIDVKVQILFGAPRCQNGGMEDAGDLKSPVR